MQKGNVRNCKTEQNWEDETKDCAVIRKNGELLAWRDKHSHDFQYFSFWEQK
jgi:hypothetical protein